MSCSENPDNNPHVLQPNVIEKINIVLKSPYQNHLNNNKIPIEMSALEISQLLNRHTDVAFFFRGKGINLEKKEVFYI